jgi:hypothetical protein
MHNKLVTKNKNQKKHRVDVDLSKYFSVNSNMWSRTKVNDG